VQLHFIQRKQLSEVNATSRGFQKISDLEIFHELPRAFENAVAGDMHWFKYIAQILLLKSKTKHLPITTYFTRGKWLP